MDDRFEAARCVTFGVVIEVSGRGVSPLVDEVLAAASLVDSLDSWKCAC
jgi:hypothetical protein